MLLELRLLRTLMRTRWIRKVELDKRNKQTNIYIYITTLKKYPRIIIKNQTTQKKVKSSFIFITFLSMRNSGKLSPTTAIIKASPVPRGIHFTMSAWIIGITLVVFAYIGIPIITAIGTANGLLFVIYFSKNQVGMNQWMSHPIATHKRTYGMIFQIRAKLSLITSLMNFFQFIFSFSMSTGAQLFFQINSATSHSIFSFQIIHPPIIPRNIQDAT